MDEYQALVDLWNFTLQLHFDWTNEFANRVGWDVLDDQLLNDVTF
jgi:hypothetical protein